MNQISVGLQLYSVRKALTNDFSGTLDQVSEIGYKNIELFFEGPHLARFDVPCSSSELLSKTSKLGLHIVSSQVIYHPYLDWDEVINYNVEINSEGITIPMYLYNLNSKNTKSQEAFTFSNVLNKLGKKCKDNGLKLHYHNYYNEFEKFDGKYIYDILLENTDPELVSFELDVYWATRGGVDPVFWMDKVGKRCVNLQVQDLVKDAKNRNLVEVEGAFDNAFYPKIHTHYGDYAEVGNGVLDFNSIFAKAKEMDSIKNIIVNQFESGKKKEFESAKENLETINKMLIL